MKNYWNVPVKITCAPLSVATKPLNCWLEKVFERPLSSANTVLPLEGVSE